RGDWEGEEMIGVQHGEVRMNEPGEEPDQQTGDGDRSLPGFRSARPAPKGGGDRAQPGGADRGNADVARGENTRERARIEQPRQGDERVHEERREHMSEQARGPRDPSAADDEHDDAEEPEANERSGDRLVAEEPVR